jgi:hypothetical protein
MRMASWTHRSASTDAPVTERASARAIGPLGSAGANRTDSRADATASPPSRARRSLVDWRAKAESEELRRRNATASPGARRMA